MASKSHTRSRRLATAAERRGVHVQLRGACYGQQFREPVRSPRTVGGIHVTAQSR